MRKTVAGRRILTIAPVFKNKLLNLKDFLQKLFQHLKVESAWIHVTDVHAPAVNLNAAGFRAGQVVTHKVVVEVKNIEMFFGVYDFATHPRRWRSFVKRDFRAIIRNYADIVFGVFAAVGALFK